MYYFNQSNQYFFFVLEADNIKGFSYENLEASPIIRVVNQNTKPTREQVLSDSYTGTVLESLNSWVNTPDLDGKIINLSAIADPQPDEEYITDRIWITVRYKLEATGDENITVRYLDIKRPNVVTRKINVVPADLIRVQPGIEKYSNCTGNDLTGAITNAITDTLLDFSHCDDIQSQLLDPRQLCQIVIYRALYMLNLDNSQGTGDGFNNKAGEYKRRYQELIEKINFRIDHNNDGRGESSTSAKRTFGVITLRR